MAGLTIGQMAERTGLAVSAIRYYETMGLVAPVKTDAGHRRYDRSDIRKLSFVIIAQELGIPLKRIAEAMAVLPEGRAPSKRDWSRISAAFRDDLDERITRATRLRDQLDGCIGCGCLSLKSCALYNRSDRARRAGPGPRYILDGSPKS